eukprot:364197-Chlamydomonas_euryale.AAC.19
MRANLLILKGVGASRGARLEHDARGRAARAADLRACAQVWSSCCPDDVAAVPADGPTRALAPPQPSSHSTCRNPKLHCNLRFISSIYRVAKSNVEEEQRTGVCGPSALSRHGQNLAGEQGKQRHIASLLSRSDGKPRARLERRGGAAPR